MDVIYQCTIFVDLTLLAILVAIFIFASSLYRGAALIAMKEEEEAIIRRKYFIDAEKKKLAEQIQEINEDVFKTKIRSEIDRLSDEIDLADKNIEAARHRNRALTLRRLVCIPGLLILASVITSGIALALSTIIVWVASFVLTLVGVFLIYRNLSAIEYFSHVIDLSTLMEQALGRHARKSQPVVRFEFWNPLPEGGLRINCGEEKEVEFIVSLIQGTRGKGVRIRFSCSEELDFPGKSVEKDDRDFMGMKKPKRFWTAKTDLNRKEYQKSSFKLKAPEIPGQYIMAYWVQCEEYTSTEEFFSVNVI